MLIFLYNLSIFFLDPTQLCGCYIVFSFNSSISVMGLMQWDTNGKWTHFFVPPFLKGVYSWKQELTHWYLVSVALTNASAEGKDFLLPRACSFFKDCPVRRKVNFSWA